MKNIVLIICCLFINYCVLSQTTSTTAITPGKPAKQDTSRTRYWIEYPKGNFKSGSSYTASTDLINAEHLVLRTALYDTGVGGPPPTLIEKNTVLVSNTFSSYHDNNNPPILTSQKKIMLQPSVPELVEGDMMVFALTYNTGISAVPDSTTTYTAYFFYNQASEAIFFDETLPGNFNNTDLPAIRTHNGEAVDRGLTSSMANIRGIDPALIKSYKYFIAFRNIKPSEYEKNVFVTLLPATGIIEGTATSVLGVLIKTNNPNGSTIETFQDQFLLEGLKVSLAHDPNYLKVKPACIESTKRGGHSIEYMLHFQNTGPGPADTVLVTLHMPKGLDLKNFNSSKVTRAVYGGIDFKADLDLITVDEINNNIVFKFNPHKRLTNTVFLVGTDSCLNPAADIRTMGDIIFSVVTTDAADSVLNAYASIEFHSKYAGRNSKYELPVNTNTSTVRITPCCDCTKCDCTPGCCYKIAGLCWWWWVIIFLLLTTIYIVLRRRKKAAQC